MLVNSRLSWGQQGALGSQQGKPYPGVHQTEHHQLPKMVIIPLYSVLVQHHLESCGQFWAPQFNEDMKVLECIQRRTTKLVKGLEEVSYEDKIRTFYLSSLEKRTLEGNFIALFNFLQRENREREKNTDFFSLECSDGNCLKLH